MNAELADLEDPEVKQAADIQLSLEELQSLEESFHVIDAETPEAAEAQPQVPPHANGQDKNGHVDIMSATPSVTQPEVTAGQPLQPEILQRQNEEMRRLQRASKADEKTVLDIISPGGSQLEATNDRDEVHDAQSQETAVTVSQPQATADMDKVADTQSEETAVTVIQPESTADVDKVADGEPQETVVTVTQPASTADTAKIREARRMEELSTAEALKQREQAMALRAELETLQAELEEAKAERALMTTSDSDEAEPEIERVRPMKQGGTDVVIQGVTTQMASQQRRPIVEMEGATFIRAPMRMAGPYPVLSLRFPEVTAPEEMQQAQQMTGETGVAIEFMIDTAANINTINGQLAERVLNLTVVGGDTGFPMGPFGGPRTYLLGDCQLNDVPKDERVLLLSGLQASGLPVGSPTGAGLLGIGFLFAFVGGVELNWGDLAAVTAAQAAGPGVAMGAMNPDSLPSLTMYSDIAAAENLTEGLSEVPARQLADNALLSLTIKVNDVELPALLDTGSPITVLNAAAAKAVGVEVKEERDLSEMNWGAQIMNRFRIAKRITDDFRKGDVVALPSPRGVVYLKKAEQNVTLALGDAEFEETRLFVGEMPGLAALDGLGEDAKPAVLLGTDILRQRRKLVIQNGKVFL
jgi:hypothetical protein